MSYPSRKNKCFAFQVADRVGREKQKVYCLSNNYLDCHIFQQVTNESTENVPAFEETVPLSRIVRVRILALSAMLVLALLTALIWRSASELSIKEGSIFSAPFSLNSLATMLAATKDQPAIEDYSEKSEPDSEVPLQIAIFDLPDLYQWFQNQQQDNENGTKSNSDFNPIAYGNHGEEIWPLSTSLPMIEVATARHDGLILRSAPEENSERSATLNKGDVVDLLGRWKDGPWVRVRQNDDIEGWVKIDSLALADS